MSPTTWHRFSMFLIAVAVIVGVIAAIAGVWWTAVVMVLVVAFQILALRRREQVPGDH